MGAGGVGVVTLSLSGRTAASGPSSPTKTASSASLANTHTNTTKTIGNTTTTTTATAGGKKAGGDGGLLTSQSTSSSSSSGSSSLGCLATTTKPPTASTFSFKAPALPFKQRRGSLALPSSPRVVEGHTFRDDTGLNALHGGLSSAPLPKKIRKFENNGSALDNDALLLLSPSTTPEKPEKKARKKWSDSETKMLVTGCNKHGVGNWKTILRDPTLQFDNRSPVDLKDRFRTYFPDAYKLHYPNAKTHLSSKVRSTLPDGTPLFEKTRSKRRRPFTEEEDRALKEGYEKYGTVWATIVKEYPVFQDQNRRSTDLRDRFRNAFPELYQLAGYKPRNAAKKKMAGGTALESPTTPTTASAGLTTKRAATDDQLGTTSTGGPVRSRRRAYTNQGLLRGGTKSVPQSTACTEDEDSSAGEEEGLVSPGGFRMPHTPDTPGSPTKKLTSAGAIATSVSVSMDYSSSMMPYDAVEDEEMDMITLDPLAEALALPDLMSNHESHSHAWSSGVSTPTHSNHWSTAAGSPTSSHLSSDILMNTGSHSSPFTHHQRRSDSLNSGNNNNMGMIGKSAWGTDWFSPNPRLDPSSNVGLGGVGVGGGGGGGGGGVGNSTSYLDHHTSPSPASSPFSFHQLNQNVLDRYDLFPTSMPSDFSSEVGVGDSHSTFSDELFQPSGFRGFTHHSSYAGDLIFGARTHFGQQGGGSGGGQHLQNHQSSFLHGSSIGGAFGFGSLGLTGLSAAVVSQQQQQQQQQNAGIHPMQLHTPSILSGIDEAGIGGLVLDDRSPNSTDGGGAGGGVGSSADPLGIPLPPESMDEDLREDVAMGDVSASVSTGQMHSHQQQQGTLQMQRTPSTQQDQQGQLQHHQDPQRSQQQRKDTSESSKPLSSASASSSMLEPFGLDDLVDLSNNELHTTPPATPLTHPRPLRRSSGGTGANGGSGPSGSSSGSSILHQFPSPGSLHARSVSVPPSEFRSGGGMMGQNMSVLALIDYEYEDAGMGRMGGGGMGGFFGRGQAPSISQQLEQAEGGGGVGQRQGRGMMGSGSAVRQGRSGSSELPMARLGGNLGRRDGGGEDDDEDSDDGHEDSDPRPQTPTLASRHLLSLPGPVTPSLSVSSSSSSQQQRHSPSVGTTASTATTAANADDPWKPLYSTASLGAELYNLPFLDLHYYGGSGMGGGLNGMLGQQHQHQSQQQHLGNGMLGSGGDDMGYMDAGHQALDLAAGGMGGGGGGVGLRGLKLVDVSSFGNFLAGKSQAGVAHLHSGNQIRNSSNTGTAATTTTETAASNPSAGFMHDFDRGHAAHHQHHGHHHQHQSTASLGGGIFKSGMGGGGQTTSTIPSGILGRSQSHHRGQSAVVNPQDLMMRSDNNKRKRASWDGRQV